jgi:hypothetical protein
MTRLTWCLIQQRALCRSSHPAQLNLVEIEPQLIAPCPPPPFLVFCPLRAGVPAGAGVTDPSQTSLAEMTTHFISMPCCFALCAQACLPGLEWPTPAALGRLTRVKHLDSVAACTHLLLSQSLTLATARKALEAAARDAEPTTGEALHQHTTVFIYVCVSILLRVPCGSRRRLSWVGGRLPASHAPPFACFLAGGGGKGRNPSAAL